MIRTHRICLWVLLIFVGWACDEPVEEATQETDAPAVVVAERLVRAWAKGDTAAAAKLLAGAMLLHHHPSSERDDGLEEFAWQIEHVHAWASDVIGLSKKPTSISDDIAVVEWSLSGVQNRPIGDLVPIVTNRPFSLRGVTVVEMKDTVNVLWLATYVDVASLVLDLGGRIELPGGRELVPSEFEETEAF